MDPDAPETEGAAGVASALRLVLALLVTSLGAAAFAVTFRAALHAFYRLGGADDVLGFVEARPRLIRLALPALGGLAAGLVTALRTPKSGGVGAVMEAVALGNRRISLRSTSWQAFASFCAIAVGGSIGREGPLIQFGGSLGDAVGRVSELSDVRKRALVAAGTAAGFGAAYNTPLAAILFVLEIVTGIVVLDALLAVMIGTALAVVVTRAFVGVGPLYGVRTFAYGASTELVAYALLGVLAALAAQAFMRVLSAGETLFVRTRVPQPVRATLGGLVVGAFAVELPEICGNGYEPLARILDGRYALAFVAVLLLAKIVATTASVASGIPGGVFTPSLLVGGAIGVLFAGVLRHALGTASAGSYALVGMAAVVAATTHAPLMASVLVFEMSRDYELVVPLVLATAIATLLSKAMRPESIYSAELRRRGVAWDLTLEGRRVR